MKNSITNINTCIYCGSSPKYERDHELKCTRKIKTKICKFGKAHRSHYCNCAFGTFQCNMCKLHIFNYKYLSHLESHYEKYRLCLRCKNGKVKIISFNKRLKMVMKCSCGHINEDNSLYKKYIMKKICSKVL